MSTSPMLPPGVRVAAPRDRFWAAMIDGGITLLLLLPAYLVLFAGIVAEAPLIALASFPLFLIGTVASWVHLAVYTGRLGQTVGKHLRGIEVRTIDTGRLDIGVGRAFGREFIKGVGAQVFLLGLLWILWDDLRRGWHDHAVDTVVIVTGRPRPSLGTFLRAAWAPVPLAALGR